MITIGRDTLTSGALTTADAVLLDGRLEGTIRCPRLHIGLDGYLLGEAYAEEIVVEGQVVGNLRGRTVKLTATAVVEGNVHHETLGMDGSAVLVGRIERLAAFVPPAEVAALTRRQREDAAALDEMLHDSLGSQASSAGRSPTIRPDAQLRMFA